jgi:peptidoglycan/xylan/chitin deacetylase (PgdA/CDA1 family)
MAAIRFDRLMTLYCARPLVRLGGAGRESTLPILMYHSISAGREAGVSPYFGTTTSPAVFDSHLAHLRAKGFRAVSLSEAAEALRQPRAGIEKLVAITFDDGFKDFYDEAFPILRRHGFTATMYLSSGVIGDGRKTFKNRECMSWEQVRELRKNGIEFGSHTVSHPRLYKLGWREIETELALSKEQIESGLGEGITSFAYPYAFPQQDQEFTARFSDLLKGLGYKSCVTTIIGRARKGDDLLRLKRLPMNDWDDEALMTAKLEGAYDWLALPQDLFKRAKQLLPSSRRLALEAA